MSEDRRPSPVQPPFVSSPADTMAQLQRPAQSGFYLPPIHGGSQQGTAYHEGRTLPPIQLPPMRMSAPEQRVPVASLLSDDSSSTIRAGHQPRAQWTQPDSQQAQYWTSPQAHPHHQQTHFYPQAQHHPQQPQYYSPHSSYSNSPGDPHNQPPVHYQSAQHSLDRPPIPIRHPSTQSQAPQYAYPNPRKPSGGSESDHHRPSPAMSSHSFSPGYYSHSPEASPQTSVAAPTQTFAAQPRISEPPPFNYNITIRQQPVAARACGFGERDRRVIDPPPILELKITDKATGAPESDPTAMLALHCTLLSPDGREDETEVPPAHPEMPSTRRLMGTLVASPYQAKDEQGTAGTFFVFPDLSCRSPGKFRLKFKLLRVDPTNMTPGARHGSVASIITDVFSVFTAKDFPGMRASSALLKSLRRQGLNVGVKKGSEARRNKGKGKKGSSSDDEEDDDDSDVANGSSEDVPEDTGPPSKSRKKGKKRQKDQ